MKGRTSWIGLFVACSIGICSGAAIAQPAGPPAGYQIEEKYTQNFQSSVSLLRYCSIVIAPPGDL